jgi:hypothetical protein
MRFLKRGRLLPVLDGPLAEIGFIEETEGDVREPNRPCLLTRLPVHSGNDPATPPPPARTADLRAFTPPPCRPSARRP